MKSNTGFKAPTMREARKRWSSHTKHVLTDDAKRAAKESVVWDEGYQPVVILGRDARYRFVFEFGVGGNVHARQISS
jgi:hypothetical protein